MLEKTLDGEVLVITPTARYLDAQNAAELRTRFEEIIDPEKLVLLNLEHVEMVDSSGLAAIISCFQMLELREELAICSPNKRVMQLFEMTNLQQILRIYPDRETALAKLRAQG